jgi:hypothetical protein
VFFISDQKNDKKSYAIIGVILMVASLPMLWHYSFISQSFGLLPVFEVLIHYFFFTIGLGSSLTVMMHKDLGAKRALVIFGMLVFFASTFSFYNMIVYMVDRLIYYSPDAVSRLFREKFEIILVSVSFIIAGARLLISGLFYVLKNRDFSLYIQ